MAEPEKKPPTPPTGGATPPAGTPPPGGTTPPSTPPPGGTPPPAGGPPPPDPGARPGATPPLPPQTPPVPPVSPKDPRSVGELVFDVSERTSSLVREEIELAKTEVAEKAASLGRGAAVGIAAGTFAFLALILIMHGIAWLLNEEVFDGKAWPGFLVEAAIFLLVAALAALIAYRAVKKGSPPVPTQAIEEAKLTKETLVGEETK